MDTRKVDVAIIGAGSAGLAARREIELRGRSYVLIDKGPHGTTCARVGCMPSKLLIAAADAHHEVKSAGVFGINVPDGVEVDGRAVMARVQRERDRFVSFVVESVDGLPEERRLDGLARFVDETVLEVTGHDGSTTRVEAGAVILATGTTPWSPPVLDSVHERTLTSDSIFELEELPKSVAVFGTGIVGVELGQALTRLGVRVAFFNPFDVLGPLADPEVGAKARAVLSAELDLHLGAENLMAELDGDEVVVHWTSKGESRQERFEWVLSGAGRRPDFAPLNLEAAGITPDARGRIAYDPRTMRVGDRPVFIAGDVNGDRALLHEAADEGRIAGANATLYPQVLGHMRRTPLAVVFSHPQMAVVGQGWRDVDPSAIVIGEVSYDDQGRARVMNQNAGLVRIYADRERGQILGAEMFGPRVEHTAHLLAWAVGTNTTVQEALKLPFYHPVIEEGIRTGLRDAARKLELQPPPCAFELDCGPGNVGREPEPSVATS